MILSKTRGFLFLRIPKTASTSLGHHIVENIPNEEIDLYSGVEFANNLEQSKNILLGPHPTLDELYRNNFLKEEEIFSLNVFTVMRHPIDRFISMAHFVHCSENKLAKSDLSDDKVCDRYLRFLLNGSSSNKNIAFFSSQSRWLKFKGKLVTKPYKYPDFKSLLNSMGISNTSITHQYNAESRPNSSQRLSKSIETKIQAIYEEDFEAWETLCS